MNEFIQQYADAFKLFQAHQFKDPIIYRSKEGEPDPDKILFLVTDMCSMENETVRSATRIWRLKCELQRYFDREVYVLTPDDLKPEKKKAIFFEKDRPTLLLTEQFCSESQKQSLKKELVHVLGEAWVEKDSLVAGSRSKGQAIFFESSKKEDDIPTIEELLTLMKLVVEKNPKAASRLKEEAIKLDSDVTARQRKSPKVK